jgi:hypothetical protein
MMMLTSTIPKGPRRPWKRVVLGVVTAALLLPLPAMAITFLGSWSVIQFRTGGAPAATVTSGDSGGGGFLSVNLGNYSASRAAVSQVTAVRSFRVRSSGELVNFERQLSTQIRNANLKVEVQFLRITGRSKFPISSVTESAGSTMRTVNFNQTDSRFLTGGLYMAVLTVRQQKSASGSWNNVSPYRFTFTSI